MLILDNIIQFPILEVVRKSCVLCPSVRLPCVYPGVFWRRECCLSAWFVSSTSSSSSSSCSLLSLSFSLSSSNPALNKNLWCSIQVSYQDEHFLKLHPKSNGHFLKTGILTNITKPTVQFLPIQALNFEEKKIIHHNHHHNHFTHYKYHKQNHYHSHYQERPQVVV